MADVIVCLCFASSDVGFSFKDIRLHLTSESSIWKAHCNWEEDVQLGVRITLQVHEPTIENDKELYEMYVGQNCDDVVYLS